MRKLFLVGSLAALTTACVSKSEYDRQMAEVASISAEKDSLLNEVVQTSQFIASVNTELDKVRSGKPTVAAAGEMESMSPTAARAALAERVKGLTDRLRESEERLAQSRRRVNALTASSATMEKQLAQYDSTIKSFQVLIDNQKAEIVSLLEQTSVLTSENTSLREANVGLEAQRVALVTEKEALAAEQNTVYWVAGRKDDLRQRGIIEYRGGMLGIGRTPVLARTLDATAFTAADRTMLQQLTLPDSTKSYRIISTNDLSGLDGMPNDGRFRGSLRIASADTFWRPSRFLVLIEQ